ncbi:PTS system, mannose-specific IIB component [Enterococcus sp. DIV2402]|uniref:PTS system, mannose-specific IIB component n=1 Tax=Candidatus Enterococcus lowellii TaxID=2230877 RepID=A0ABZ2SIY1_9ENTE|nr:PTS sugar transporter subunit IIB [Enterococcus sp. DIV2402]MBO0465159.1 PTS sugar transporter subunit IIB [Enterococcus sp. DIV2402]
MSVKFCRIDDRLIHGQVVTTWVNVHQIEQVIIVNETVANDKIQANVLKMSAPPTIKLHIFPPEKFLNIIQKNPISRNTMLLFASPFDVETLVNAGYEIPKLNVGGMRGNAERAKLTKAVSLTPTERESFERMLAKGMDIEIQMVPSESIIKMKEVL